MQDFLEQEYKYRADNISLTDFKKLMKTLPIKSKLQVSSWDYYYCNNEEGSFLRFRDSPTPELTKKVKLNVSNCWKRWEIDLPLDKDRVDKETVTKFVELLGYQENFRVFKTCFVYWLDKVNYVFYNVFDENMKEVGRYIEVECNKNSGADQSHLDEAADKLKELGLNPSNRMKKSIFELYNK